MLSACHRFIIVFIQLHLAYVFFFDHFIRMTYADFNLNWTIPGLIANNDNVFSYMHTNDTHYIRLCYAHFVIFGLPINYKCDQTLTIFKLIVYYVFRFAKCGKCHFQSIDSLWQAHHIHILTTEYNINKKSPKSECACGSLFLCVSYCYEMMVLLNIG